MFHVRRHRLRRRRLTELLLQLRQQQGAHSAIPLTAVERTMSQPQLRPLAVYALVRESCCCIGYCDCGYQNVASVACSVAGCFTTAVLPFGLICTGERELLCGYVCGVGCVAMYVMALRMSRHIFLAVHFLWPRFVTGERHVKLIAGVSCSSMAWGTALVPGLCCVYCMPRGWWPALQLCSYIGRHHIVEACLPTSNAPVPPTGPPSAACGSGASCVTQACYCCAALLLRAALQERAQLSSRQHQRRIRAACTKEEQQPILA
jgi:hypothetical protein